MNALLHCNQTHGRKTPGTSRQISSLVSISETRLRRSERFWQVGYACMRIFLLPDGRRYLSDSPAAWTEPICSGGLLHGRSHSPAVHELFPWFRRIRADSAFCRGSLLCAASLLPRREAPVGSGWPDQPCADRPPLLCLNFSKQLFANPHPDAVVDWFRDIALSASGNFIIAFAVLVHEKQT